MTIYAQFDNAAGLREGAPVWLLGVEIGRVDDIKLQGEGSLVALRIKENKAEFIYSNAKAKIATMGLLGDKYVELSSGTSEAPDLEAGDVLTGMPTLAVEDIVQTSAASIRNVDQLIESLDHLVTVILESEGTVSKLLTDSELYREMTGTISAADDILQNIRDSKGTLAMMVEDPTLYRRLVRTANSMQRITNTLIQDSGTVQKLLHEDDLYQSMENSFNNLSSMLHRFDNGNGTFATLLSDTVMAKNVEELVANLNSLIVDMQKRPKRYFKFEIF
jgi:phospholipid/cholesterol/gamma-HCH transport system substrate-binding protein